MHAANDAPSRANATHVARASADAIETDSVISMTLDDDLESEFSEFNDARDADADAAFLDSNARSLDALSALERENELFDVVVKMRKSLGGGKHRRRFTKHRNCFTGREAVQWLVASRTVRDSDAAVRLGNELMAAKLIVGVTKSAKIKFEKRSHLYSYHLGVGPGISAARYYVSTEMLAMESRMKNVRTVVDRHTAAVEALSSEHASAMERVEEVMSALKMELSVLRASVVALIAYAILPFFKTDAMALTSFVGVRMSLDSLLMVIAACAAVAVGISSLLGFFYVADLTRQSVFEGTTKRQSSESGLNAFVDDSPAKHRSTLHDGGEINLERTPSSFLQASAISIQRTASRLINMQRKSTRPEDRAGPPPCVDPARWPDSPCALRFTPADSQAITQEDQLPDSMIRAQVPFEIDSDIFKGRMIVYLRGLENTPPEIFEGKARTIQLAIQGKFKRPIAMNDCVIGQCLSRPLQNLPSRWLLALCARVVRGFGEKWGIELSMPTDERPFMLAPIALAAQAMSCEYEGDVQDIEGSIIENVDARSDIFPPGTSPSRRQKILKALLRKSKKGLADMPMFDTERVWTFGFWQSQINFLSYKIDLGVGTFNLIKIMDGQPLCFCSSTRAGEILFRMEVWHRELLRDAKEAHAKADNRKNRRGSLDFRRAPTKEVREALKFDDE